MPPTSGRATNRRFNSLLGARHSVALMVKRSADLQVRIMIHERTWRSALRRKEAPRSGALPALTLLRIPRRLQPAGDLVEGRRVLDGGGHLPGLAVGDLLHGAAQDLA